MILVVYSNNNFINQFTFISKLTAFSRLIPYVFISLADILLMFHFNKGVINLIFSRYFLI